MSLEKLIGIGENMAIKPFIALLFRYSKGKLTKAQVIASMNKISPKALTSDDESDINELIKKLDAETDKTGFLFEMYLTFGLSEYDDTIISKSELKTQYALK